MTTIDRRTFLKAGGLGLGMLALQRLLRPTVLLAQSAGQGHNKNIVVVNLLGGADGLSMVPYFGGNIANIINTELRPSIFVPPQQVISIHDQSGMPYQLGLHPAFKPLTDVAASHMKLIHGYGIPGDPGRSHDTCQILMSLGATQIHSGEMVGFMARLMDSQSWDTLQYWSLAGTNPSDVNTRKKAPVTVGDLTELGYGGLWAEGDGERALAEELQRSLLEIQTPRTALAAKFQDSLRTMHGTVMAVRRDIGTQTVGNNAAGNYADSDIGRNLRDAAKILKAKVNAPAAGLNGKDMLILTAQGGYDTHSDQANPDPNVTNFAGLIGDLASNLAVFYEDLRTSGLLQNTVVIVYSEFGRTNFQNGTTGAPTVGTDHGHASNTFVLGGPVAAGAVGDAPSASELRDQDYDAQLPKVDFRDIFADAIAWMGIDPMTIFDEPGYVRAPLGLFS